MLSTAESETGTQGYAALCEAVHDVLGFRHALPTHQGRAAEHILSQTCIKPGQIVVNNMYFTTTREHQEMAGGVFKDLIVAQAHDPQSTYPFKGEIDADALEALIGEVGARAIAYICLEANVNMAGGQPVSMANARRLSAIARYHGIPLYWDATRVPRTPTSSSGRSRATRTAPSPRSCASSCRTATAARSAARRTCWSTSAACCASTTTRPTAAPPRSAAIYEGAPTHGRPRQPRPAWPWPSAAAR